MQIMLMRSRLVCRVAGRALSVLCGLQKPMLALFMGSVTRDKVSGMLVAKIGTVLTALGALGSSCPVMGNGWQQPGPHFWVSALVMWGENSLVLNSLAAVAVHLIAILMLALAFAASTD